MSHSIDRRDDVSPSEGENKYGDVEFADPTNKKYPLDSADRVRAAWHYIHNENNASKYASDDLETIKERIRRAAKKQGVTIHGEN